MKIAIHASPLSDKDPKGIGYFFINLIKALSQIDKNNQYTLLSNKAFLHAPQSDNFTSKVIPSWPYCFSYWNFQKEVASNDYDLAIVPAEALTCFLKIPTIVLSFDLYYLQCSKNIRKEISLRSFLNGHLAKWSLKNASHILAISEDTKKDILQLTGINKDKISVMPLGFETEIFHPYPTDAIENVKLRYNIQKPYFINVSSSLWARKNLIRLIEAFAHLKEKTHCAHKLLIVGSEGPSLPEILQLIQQKKLESDIQLLYYIPRQDLPILLAGAEALVFPSLHEGYGLPIIEAMACACPVITSNISAMPEVSQNAALLIDPYNIMDIAAAMESIMASSLRKQLITKGLNRIKSCDWQVAAQKVVESYRHL